MYAIRSYYVLRLAGEGDELVGLVLLRRADRDAPQVEVVDVVGPYDLQVALAFLLRGGDAPVVGARHHHVAGRITSYNVCYTKLLRLEDFLEECEEAIDWLETQQDLIESVTLPNYLVITSYSIHYTKLYDVFSPTFWECSVKIVCLDLEGVLVPEIWIAFSERTGIPELRRTTRDEPDYDKLMKFRLDILAEKKLGLPDIQKA